MAIDSKATQDFVPIKEIRDGIIILNDGSLRGILIASSINFALKSEDEQQAVISQFQNFLNSLEFSIQITVQSRELDIRPYVALLEQQFGKATDDLMKIQIREYIEFIKSFVESSNIMTKNFFIVVPYSPPVLQKATSSSLAGLLGKRRTNLKDDTSFEEALSQLEQRMSIVEQGLIRGGVRVIQLGTEEVIELFYKLFNPGEQEKPIKLNSLESIVKSQ